MNTDNLPELPRGDFYSGPNPVAFTAEQMRQYATKAVTAALGAAPEDELTVEQLALEELLQLGYTVSDGRLNIPPEGLPVTATTTALWARILAHAPSPAAAVAEPVAVKYVPVNGKLRDTNGRHPNDNEPRTEACREALRARGNDEGQGLDGYWMWGFAAGFNAATAPARDVGAVPEGWLSAQDMADLRRLNDLFDDGEGWDLPTERMKRLAELGVIRHSSGGRYSITSFGTHCLDPEWGLPLRTLQQINADQVAAMRARIDASAAPQAEPKGQA